MVRIYGITYENKQTEYTPFRNDKPAKPWRWENDPMINIVDNHISDLSDDDLMGIFSYKFRDKTGMSKISVFRKLKENPNHDVYNFCRHHDPHIHFMNWSDDGHKGIKGYIQRCCAHVGLTYTNDPKYIIYANQFVAKKHIYVDYMNTVIKPCLELLEGDMWSEINRDAGYTRAMDKARLKELTGLDFYNYLPFICERMIIQYVWNKNLSVIELNPR